jgi:hypothetical protein
MKDKVTSERVIIDNSLYEKTTRTKYLGEISISSVREKLESSNKLITEVTGLSSEYVKTFITNKDNLLTVSKIEGIKFLAGAKPVEDHPDYYKPVLGTRASQANGFPMYEFITTPPDGRNMYTFITWRNGFLNQMHIAISAKYAQNDSYVLHRAPIPNCAFPDGHMCLGNLNEKKSYDPKAVQKMIKDMMTSGWNQDWHKNQVYFVEKNDTQMQIRWHKPMTQINECVQLKNEELITIVNRLEKEENRYNKIKTINLFHDSDYHNAIQQNRNGVQENQRVETTNVETPTTTDENNVILEGTEHNTIEPVETTANQNEETNTTPRIIDLRTPQLS